MEEWLSFQGNCGVGSVTSFIDVERRFVRAIQIPSLKVKEHANKINNFYDRPVKFWNCAFKQYTFKLNGNRSHFTGPLKGRSSKLYLTSLVANTLRFSRHDTKCKILVTIHSLLSQFRIDGSCSCIKYFH